MSDEKTVVIEGIDNENIGSIVNGARTYSQFLDMIDKVQKDVCPFCPEHFDHEKNKIFMSWGHENMEWRAWENPYPHAHTSRHIVIAPARHITHLKEMDDEDWWAHSRILRLTAALLRGGCVATRFGDPALNAGSLRHLHTNIIVPDGTGNVKVTIAKGVEKQTKNKERIRIFEKLRRAGVSPEEPYHGIGSHLTEQELDHVSDRLR